VVNDAHYAVVVGIDRYPFIRDLRGPRNDARLFAEWLTHEDGGGLPAQNVRVVRSTVLEEPLADELDVLPTTKEINRAFGEINRAIRARTEADPEVFDRSRLYVFVAGHGIAPTGGKAALLAADASPLEWGYNLEITSYADWYEKNALFREAAFFADCCRNRVNEAPASGPPFTMGATTEDRVDVLTAYATSVGTWAFEGAGMDEDPSRIRGHFSAGLLEALRGAAVDEDVGRVTAVRLAGYLTRFVDEQSARDGRTVPQTVVVTGPLGTPMMFGPEGMKPRPVQGVTIVRPASFTGPVRVIDHALQPVALLGGDTAVGRLRLADGFYQALPGEGCEGSAGSVFVDEGHFAVQGGDVLVHL
jgi:hypothetical protein